MEDTSKNTLRRERDVHYYRQRFKNRVFARLASFFAEEAERTGITKRDIAIRLARDPAQITRWLSEPGNLTLETISDLLLALDSEPEPPKIVRFADRAAPNYAHPLIARVTGAAPPLPKPFELPPQVPGQRNSETKTESVSKIVELV